MVKLRTVAAARIANAQGAVLQQATHQREEETWKAKTRTNQLPKDQETNPDERKDEQQ
jgi:hypothetical protein